MPKSVSIAIAAALQMSSWTVVASTGALAPSGVGAECLGMRSSWVFSDPVVIPDGDPAGVTMD